MSFKVSKFTADLNGDTKGGGLARANLFSVNIAAALTDEDAAALQPAAANDLLVKAAQFPGSTVAPMPINYGGRIIKLTGFRTFDNRTITILNDEGFEHRKWIQAWMYALAGKPDGDRQSLTRGSLYGQALDMTVNSYNNIGAKNSTWKFVNAWPTALGDITLDWGSDAIEEYTVEFAYEYWTHGHDTAATGSEAAGSYINVVPAQSAG